MANNAHVKRHEELMEKTAGKVRVMTQDERKQKAKAITLEKKDKKSVVSNTDISLFVCLFVLLA